VSRTVLEELVAILGFEIDDAPIKQFNSKLDNLKGSIVTLGVSMAGAAVSVFAMAKSTADVGDKMAKAAVRMGIGIEQLQELAYAGSLSDVSMEQLSGSVRVLNKNIDAALGGNKEAAKSFAELGIAIKGTDGKLKPTEKIIGEVADRLLKLPEGPKRSAAAMQIFGKSGAELLPMLKDGSAGLAAMAAEARELGVVMSAETAAASEQFNDNLSRTQAVLTGIRNIVGGRLIPILDRLNLRFLGFLKANRQIIAQRIERVFEVLSRYVENTWGFVENLVDAVQGLAAVFGGLENILVAAGIAFAIFTSGRVLYGIGQMVGAVINLGKAITLANAKALLIPILIGAAVVALGLIIEDIVAFFQGRNSITGVIVEKFKEMFGKLEEGFAGFGTIAKTALAVVLTPLRLLINGFSFLLDIINTVRGKMSLGDLAKSYISRAANVAGANTGTLSGALGLAQAPSLSAGAGVIPSEASVARPGALAGARGGAAQTNNINQTNNFTIGDNVDPFEVGRQVGKKTEDSLGPLLRETKDNFAGAGAGAY